MATEKETQQNALQKVGSSQLAQQEFFVGQIRNLFAKQNVPLTEYQIKCGNNAVAKMVQMATASNKDIFAYPQAQTLFALQNIIANEWDVLQKEGVIILQNKKYTVEVIDSKTNKPLLKDGKVVTTTKYDYYFDLRPTTQGYVKTIRMYAAGIDRSKLIQSYVVYDGDDFEDIEYIGREIKPPRCSPKRISNRVRYVVYIIDLIDGTTQYVVGRREQVVPGMIAQAKNNGAPKEDLDNMMKLETVDKILDAYEGKTFEKISYGKKEQVPYFNDTWLASYNREQMLETKLRGVIAGRMIDKEFNNEFQKQAFESVIVGVPSKQLVKERGETLDAEAQKMIDEKSFEGDKRSFKEMTIVEEEVQEEQQEEETPVVEEETLQQIVADKQQDYTQKKQEEPNFLNDEPTKKPKVDDGDNLFAGFGDSFKI